MNKTIVIILVLFTLTSLVITGCSASQPIDESEDALDRGKLTVESYGSIDKAIEKMTLEEKVGQLIQAERSGISLAEVTQYNIGSVLSGGGSTPVDNTPEGWVSMSNEFQNASRASSSGIPIIYGIDAVHGHNNVKGAVIFPHNIGLGAANDPELMLEIGKSVAKDLKATGIQWNFAPAVSIVQDVRWGRSYESFSESTERVAILGSNYVKGLQSEGIAATTKHYIGDGFTTFGTGEGENLIDRGDVTASYDDLLELYLPAYEEAIKAGTKTIMASFNSVNGVKMHAHKELLTDVLRGQLDFKGVVVSDWEAISALDGNLEEQVASAINAGVDMLMQPYNWKEVYEAIIADVNKGTISEARLDEAVSRILTLKYEVGLFEPFDRFTAQPLGGEQSQELARQAVAESLVLLKNDGTLPLATNIKVYLTGPASDSVGIQCGGWTLSWQGDRLSKFENGTSIKDAFEAVLTSGGGKLVETADEADVIVLAIGEKPYAEMMGDTANLALDGPLSLPENLDAIKAIAGTTKPVITLMISGRPLLIDDHLDTWNSFVMAWLPGTEALGITDVLFGNKKFTGTLPISWPKTSEQAGMVFMSRNNSLNEYQFKYGDGLSTK
ncbi:glycoside hydrolase family 3 protein [Fusibacter bizertensis]|uniref:beta-glucosidase n=1 Tax=Fusibacter bizertensis TaxID=1488331 RepID=A0ABT6NCJ8_9FIRM|nr:glycoside hydrolase family 3 protein [Fusibacter bizertensis]MDH8678141.1 glycoside hydrolase family 3 protein [Fusibacter bizertensis]